MRAIWIHGMGAKPNKEKIKMMERYGLTTHALHIDYIREPKYFEILRDYCKKNSIEFLVGSSHGGFLGFWLSEELSIPCLLLNPALSLRLKTKTKPNVSRLSSKLCIVALGGKDKIIDHEKTLHFMKQDEREGKQIITKIYDGEGHGFSTEAFENILKWSLNIINNK